MSISNAAIILISMAALLGSCSWQRQTGERLASPEQPKPKQAEEIIALPPPAETSEVSLEEALKRRRSVREFQTDELTWEQLGQLLWAAQGLTDAEGHRTAPSAGALYPLEIYVATPGGLYHYLPEGHRLSKKAANDLRPLIYDAALQQEALREAPAVFIISAFYERTDVKYGKTRSPRYVHLEAGHAAQNLLLQAVSLGMGAVSIGAFEDERLRNVLALSDEEQPLYLIPVGKAK